MLASRLVATFALLIVPAVLPARAADCAQLRSPELYAPPAAGQRLRSTATLPPELGPLQSPEADSGRYAELDETAARKLVKGCSLPRQVSGSGAPGDRIVLQFTVSEKGKLLTVHRIQGVFTHQLSAGFADCRFAVYKVNGTPTAFRANITIDVK